MIRSNTFRIALVIAICLLVLVFGFGGGFGPKANNSLVNDVPIAHFAHRGGDAQFPENCLEGIAHSITLGYTGVELDIHETKDRVFVLFHDDTCKRLLGIDGLVSEKDLSELQEPVLLRHSIPSRSHVPTLDAALSRIGDTLLIYLDTKFNGLDQADSLARLIARHHAEKFTLVASSSITFLTYLEFHHPELNTVLEGFDKGEEWTYWLFPKTFRPDFLSSFDDEVDDAHIAWLREHGLLANKLVYGMDSAGYVRMRAAGITRLIVDEGVPAIGR